MSDRELILARLEELGPDQVKQLHSTGGLPVHWNVTIMDWLTQKQKDAAKPQQAPSA